MNWTNTVTIVSASILIFVEIAVAAIAGGWALAGIFGLGEIGAYVLEALGALLAIYAVIAFYRRASRVAPISD